VRSHRKETCVQGYRKETAPKAAVVRVTEVTQVREVKPAADAHSRTAEVLAGQKPALRPITDLQA